MMNRRRTLQLMMGASAAALLPKASAEALARSLAMGSDATTVGPKVIAPVFTSLTLGEIKPTGWVREQMRRDLAEGFAGCLDKLCTEASSDIFCSNRLNLKPSAANSRENRHWWNGETEGNWRAGYIQMAFLTGDTRHMQACKEYVAHILSFQGADGYLGAYAEGSRFQHRGELWTQACLLRGLLDYAEVTGDAQVRSAVTRAADLIVTTYLSDAAGKPWAEGRDLATEGHDLMITDVMERLYTSTGNAKYRDFVVWLYDGWSNKVRGMDVIKFDSSDVDVSLQGLLDRSRPFRQHGVHTYEAIRVPLFLSATTGRADFTQAYRNGLEKMGRYTEVSGGAVSQEHIEDRKPDPTLSEYEYCALKEMQFTLQSALQKTGDAALGDHIENIWLNAAQGARLADGKAITYLTNDNRLRCDGTDADSPKVNKRNKFSPTHADVAVCCNPNAANIAPLYVRGMWMRHTASGGLAALLYGPCTLETSVRNVHVRIEQTTNYPFTQEIQMTVHPATELEFPIHLRDAAWSKGTTVTCRGAHITRSEGFWIVTKKWKHGDIITLTFKPVVEEVAAVNGEVALRYGALLFAQPLPSREITMKSYAVAGFADSHFVPTSKPEQPALKTDSRAKGFGFRPQVKAEAGTTLHPFDAPVVTLEGTMMEGANGVERQVSLVPLGNAPILRRLTFPVSPSRASKV